MENRLSTQTVGSAARVIVHGAGGRMGVRLCALAQEDAQLSLVGAVETRGSDAIGRALEDGRFIGGQVSRRDIGRDPASEPGRSRIRP